jgi:hypothetical protein
LELQLELIVVETDVNFVLIELFRFVMTVTSATAIKATIRAYSTMVAPSSLTTRRAIRSNISDFLLGGSRLNALI